MNRPDKVGEPSLDDILATMRQGFGDEPAVGNSVAPRPTPPQTPFGGLAPLGSAQHAASLPPGHSGTLLERLSGSLAGAPRPQAGLGALSSKRPSPIDDDLADLLDDAPPRQPPLPARPSLSISPELPVYEPNGFSAVYPAPPPLPPSGSMFAGATQPVFERAVFERAVPQASLPTPPLPPAPSVSASSVSPAAVVPPSLPSLPPLRKPGFMPPLSAYEKAPTTSPPAPSLGGATDTRTISGDDIEQALNVLSGRAPRTPKSEDVPLTEPEAAAAVAEPLPPVASFIPEPITVEAQPQPVVAEAAAYSAPSLSEEAPAALVTTATEVLDEITDFSAEADAVPTVATSALDALALGLAAAASATPVEGVVVSPPDIIEASVASEPQGEAAPEARGGFAASASLPAPPASQAAPQAPAARTLEDAVAEMLRPMLQQWLADHMPRILEKVLRDDFVKGSAGKSPGG